MICIFFVCSEISEDLGPGGCFLGFRCDISSVDSLVVSRSCFKSGIWNSYTSHRKDRDVKRTPSSEGMGFWVTGGGNEGTVA